jgi:hypothetical protein
MKYKKFLLIPVLIVVYLFFINFLIQLVSFAPPEAPTSEGQSSGGVLQIGISSGASVSVTRPYLFGLIELPVYVDTLGNISFLHDTFFAFILILTVLFVIIEWRKRRGEERLD